MSAWFQKDERTYVRPCGPTERAYVKMVQSTRRHGCEDFVVEYVIKFTENVDSPTSQGKTLDQMLRNAWEKLRFMHPMIAVQLGRDHQSLQYTVPEDEAQLTLWSQSTFIVHASDDKSAGETFASLEAPRMMEIHYFPNTSELLLRSSHWRIDGAGCSLLMNDFFDILAGERQSDTKTSSDDWGSEVSRLPPAIEDILGLPTEIPEEAKQWSSNWLGGFIAAAPSIGLTCQQSKAPGVPRRELVMMSKSDTAKLVAGCKSAGITVTAALHAAAIIQTRHMCDPDTRGNKFMDVLMSDLRPYLPESYSTGRYAVSISSMPQLTGFDSITEPDFAAIAKMVMHRSKSFDMHELLASLRAASAAFENMLDAGASSDQTPQFVPPVISSLGILGKYLEPRHKNITIERVHSFSSLRSPQPTLCLNSWQARTSLDMIYNDAYITVEQAKEFVYGVVDVVCEGLGVSMSRN